MKMLVRILLCLATVAICDAGADEVVLRVQGKLKRLGLYNGVVDGQLGSQTAAAIRRYQIAERLRVTGMLNTQTLRRLGIAAPRTRAPVRAPTRVPEYIALADLFKGGPFISLDPGVQIAVIHQAKKNLRLLGYFHGPVDGRPTPSLVSSLKAWQTSAGFRRTGRFDENTLKGLSLMPH
jgi:peptidoglycan hydrolase-like protein with peptidoglycan-binding domain